MSSVGDLDPEDVLRKLFSGRRKFPRFSRSLDVRVAFPIWDRRTLDARTVDVSRGGALVAIRDERVGLAEGIALAQALGEAPPTDGAAGAIVEFPETSLHIPANIVRVVLSTERDMALLLGLQFQPVLSRSQARALRILVARGDAVEEPAFTRAPRAGAWADGVERRTSAD
jgi:hypothetical protein